MGRSFRIIEIYLYNDCAWMKAELRQKVEYMKSLNDGNRAWNFCNEDDYNYAMVNGVKAKNNIIPWMCGTVRSEKAMKREELLAKIEEINSTKYIPKNILIYTGEEYER